MAQEVEFDIRGSADRVLALMRQQRAAEAITMLERHRHGQVLVVQEALDRYVVAEASEQLSALRGAEAVVDGASPLASVLDRLETATEMPRFPGNGFHPGDSNEFDGLTDGQRYDVYASMVGTRGDVAANDALAGNDRVILGLRRENSTLEATDDLRTTRIDESRNRAGTGVYDDRIVVLWRGADGRPYVHEVNRANTEPTAQYDLGLQQATLSLLARAKADPLVQRIDEVRFSQATRDHAAGHALIGLYRPFGDKEPAFGVHVETQVASRAPVGQALQALADTERQQTQERDQRRTMDQSNEREAGRRMV